MPDSSQTKEAPNDITWQAESHKQHLRSPAWYVIFGLVALCLIIFGIWSKSVTTVATFITVIFVVIVITSQKPRMLNYKVTKTGIAVGETVYPYKVIKTFWINYRPPEIKTLNFETSAYLNNLVTLQLGNQDPVTLKLFLSQYLRENLEREESFSETLARRLKI